MNRGYDTQHCASVSDPKHEYNSRGLVTGRLSFAQSECSTLFHFPTVAYRRLRRVVLPIPQQQRQPTHLAF